MIKKIAPLAGMLGPLLFTISFTVNGFLRQDYDPVKRYVSELSIGSNGWIQIASFMLLGVSLMLFVPAIKSAFPTGKASRAAPVLFIIIAVCYFLSGPFVTDPMAMFDNQQTIHGILHGIFGAIVFSLSSASCFVLWRRFRIDEKWKSMAAFTLIAGIVTVILIVFMKIGQLQTNLFSDWAGVIQRCCLITFYIWTFAVSFRMRKVFFSKPPRS